MVHENYYLSLLLKKTNEIKEILEDAKSKNHSDEYMKQLLSGYIITLDSILEIGLSDLHSPVLDEVTTLIYFTRQKIVHYGYFNAVKGIEETANKIVELLGETYEQGQEYYKKIFSFQINEHPNNIVIKNSNRIEEDKLFCWLKSTDGTKLLCVPRRSAFRITQRSKEKVNEYIIDTSYPLDLYYLDNGSFNFCSELKDDELKFFLSSNFHKTGENFNQHEIVMRDIVNNFVTDPLNSVHILEHSYDEQFCRNTIDVIKEFMLEKCMYEEYIKNHYLIKEKRSLSKSKGVDYQKLHKTIKNIAADHITEKDVFFINMFFKRFSHYENLINDSCDPQNFKPEALAPILIQLFEMGPKHFSKEFRECCPEFNKAYSNLHRYRQIFSHYIIFGKEYREGLKAFKEELIEFLGVLHHIDLANVKHPMKETPETFQLLERKKSDFFNYKHEQFLKINDDTYIGKKINYSSRYQTKNCDSLIAIIPGGKNASNITYYKKDLSGYISPKYTNDEKTGKKHCFHLLDKPLHGAKETRIDFSLANLFKAYHTLSFGKNKGDIYILFPACKDNNFNEHYDSLETVILRFFTQGYLPIELLQKTFLNTSAISKGCVILTDSNGNPLANIVNKQKFIEGKRKDPKDHFSRIDLPHDFGQRRHQKW